MAIITDVTQYSLVPFIAYDTLPEKLTALLSGEMLLVKKFEQTSEADVLVRLEQKKYWVTQISYDIKENPLDARYWVTFNLGVNDLSLFTVFQYNDEVFSHTNKFMLNDIVTYRSIDGLADSAIVEAVYVSNAYPNGYAYRLSRDPDVLYTEDELTRNKYA